MEFRKPELMLLSVRKSVHDRIDRILNVVKLHVREGLQFMLPERCQSDLPPRSFTKEYSPPGAAMTCPSDFAIILLQLLDHLKGRIPSSEHKLVMDLCSTAFLRPVSAQLTHNPREISPREITLFYWYIRKRRCPGYLRSVQHLTIYRINTILPITLL
jgi:hypothetical protein